MELIIRRREIYATLAILGGFCAWLAFAFYDLRIMREDLETIAAAHIDDWFEGGVETLDRAQYDYMAIVDSEKAFTLFGRGWGVVHTYFREKGDEDFATFKGIEFYYMRDGGDWVLQDSAGCGAFEHHLRAFDRFMEMGVDVPARVYNRALGVDSDEDFRHLNAQRAAERQAEAS